MRPLFDVGEHPPTLSSLRVDARTTPARLTLRAMTGAKRYTGPAALLAVTHQIGEALVPVLTGIAVERALATGDLRELLLWLAVLAADFVLLSFSWRFGSRLAELGMLTVAHRLRTQLVERLLFRRAERGRASDQPGIAISLATSDVSRLAGAAEIAVYPLGQFAAVLFGGAVLLTLSWPLGLAVLIGAPLLLWTAERAGRALQRRSEEEQESAAIAAGRAADLLAGYRVLRGIRAEDEAVRRYRDVSQGALRSVRRARTADGVFGGAMEMAAGLLLVAVTVAAVLLALAGSLSLGALIAVVGLTQFLIDPMQNVARYAGAGWARAMGSATRLLDVLRESGDPAGASDASESSDIGTREAVRSLLEGLAPGELIVVAVDGPDAEHFLGEARRIRADAVVAPHASHLFGGSVRENVTLPGSSADDLRGALTAAGCDEFLDAHPDGLDRDVGEAGASLSGGQRQRIALARALASDAELLILHDPTTAVDAVTELRIAESVALLRCSRRTVVVTRSGAFRAVADRVITDVGAVVSDPSGEHSEPTGAGR